LFCWYWWNSWPSLFKLSFVFLILVELLTITVKAFFCFVDIGGIVGHQCLNFLLFCWYWWIVDHHYQQNKRKFKQWWSTIPPISTKQKKALSVMVNNSPISTKQKKV
jgi:hypothetical protein